MNLFELAGTIAINGADKAQSDIEATTSKAGSASTAFKNGIATIGKWGAALGSATVSGVKALTNLAVEAAGTSDNIDKMSQKIGISREAYQELDFVFSQSGTSVDNLQTGMKTLVTAMDKAASGTEANVEQFEKLGVSVTNADGSLRSSEDVMWETMAALQGMDNQTEKARLATELFGKSGTELMPLLNGASGSIEEMRNQAHELGLVLDDETIDAGVSLTDTMDQMKRSLSAVVTNLGAKLMPIIEEICNFVIENLPTIQGIFDEIAPVAINLFKQLVPVIKQMASKLLPVIVDLVDKMAPLLIGIINDAMPILLDIMNELAPVIEEILPLLIDVVKEILPVIKELITPITSIIKQLLPVVVKLLKQMLPIISKLLTTALPIISDLLTPLLDLLAPLLELLSPLLEMISSLIEPLLKLSQSILKPLISVLSSIIGKLVDKIKPVLNWLVGFVKDFVNPIIQKLTGFFNDLGNGSGNAVQKIKNAWSNVGAFFSGIFNKIKDIFRPIVEWFKTLFTNAWNGIKNVFSAVGSFFGNVWNAIKNAFAATVAWFKLLFANAWNAIKGVFGAVGSFFGNIWTNIKTAFSNVVDWFKNLFTNAWTGIKNAFGISNAKSFFELVWDGIKKPFSSVATWFKDTFKKAWQAVKDVFSSGGNIFTGIKEGIISAFKTVVNFLIEGLNTIIAAPFVKLKEILWYIKDLKIAGAYPFSWIKPTVIPTPQIPKLAKGGVLKKGQVGYLEGDGDEAVVPLSQNTEWIDKVAAKINGNGGNNAVVKKLDELINAITSMNICLDTGAMVGEMTPAFDTALGNRYAAKGRGRI